MDDRRFDIVLWDWNGTLLDDGAFGLGIINGMLARRGMPTRSREEHQGLFDFPVIRYYERLGFNFQAEPFEEISQEFVDAYIANVTTCELREGSREVLQALQAAGYRQSVLSASRQDYLEELIAHYGLLEYFDELLGIDSVHAPGKSGRGCDWIRESNIDPSRVILVGDTVHDAEVAMKMGIQCWLLEGGHHPSERLLSTGFPCLPDLSRVQALLTNQEESVRI